MDIDEDSQDVRKRLASDAPIARKKIRTDRSTSVASDDTEVDELVAEGGNQQKEAKRLSFWQQREALQRAGELNRLVCLSPSQSCAT